MASTLKVQNIAHTDGTTGLSVDSAGRVTKPQIPFLICKNQSGANITPSSYNGVVPYDTILSSRGITLNTSTYRFTVPINGIYNVAAAVRLELDLSYVFWRVVDYNSGSHLQVQDGKIILSNGVGNNESGGPDLTTACGSLILSLETGKEYQINVSSSPETNTSVYPGQTWLDVHLIG